MWGLGYLGETRNEKAPKTFGRDYLETKKRHICLFIFFSLFHINYTNHIWDELILSQNSDSPNSEELKQI